MNEVAGSEKHYPADLILLAMGFVGPEKKVPADIGKFKNFFKIIISMKLMEM